MRVEGLLASPGKAEGTLVWTHGCNLKKVEKAVRTYANGGPYILAAHMTEPQLEPVMVRATGIVTVSGGRLCHAAIVARELGIPCLVSCSDLVILNSGAHVRLHASFEASFVEVVSDGHTNPAAAGGEAVLHAAGGSGAGGF
jgi:pyruvate,water dikinase